MIGKHEEAKRIFSKVSGWTRKVEVATKCAELVKHFSFDEFGKRKAGEYLERVWDELETCLLILSVMDKAKDYERELEYLNEVEDMTCVNLSTFA